MYDSTSKSTGSQLSQMNNSSNLEEKRNSKPTEYDKTTKTVVLDKVVPLQNDDHDMKIDNLLPSNKSENGSRDKIEYLQNQSNTTQNDSSSNFNIKYDQYTVIENRKNLTAVAVLQIVHLYNLQLFGSPSNIDANLR